MDDLVTCAAADLGITLAFSDEGVEEVGRVPPIKGHNEPALSVGDAVSHATHYFMPVEVKSLLGEPANAMTSMDLRSEITAREISTKLIEVDLAAGQRHVFSNAYGNDVVASVEDPC